MTSLSLVEAPQPAVDLSIAKDFLHVWHSDDDVIITHLLEAATEKLDGVGGALGRCLMPQTWKLSLDCFPSGPIKLPLPPFREIVSIKYFDRNGDEQTLAPSAYVETGAGGTGIVSPIGAWPDTWDFPGAVSIEFEAGFDEVPAALKQAIMGLAFFWYAQRGVAAQPNSETVETPFGFDDAVAQWRVPFVG